MTPPRELEKRYTANQPVRRDTVFQLCFAFRLDGADTHESFRKVYAKERSFDCHCVQEAVYYFCLNTCSISPTNASFLVAEWVA